MTSGRRWDAIELFTLPGCDRDCARAILSQSRGRGGISDIQVEHLLAVGYRAGEQRGRERGFDHARRLHQPAEDQLELFRLAVAEATAAGRSVPLPDGTAVIRPPRRRWWRIRRQP